MHPSTFFSYLPSYLDARGIYALRVEEGGAAVYEVLCVRVHHAVIYLLGIDDKAHFLVKIDHFIGQVERECSFPGGLIVLDVLDGDVPSWLTLGHLIIYAVYGEEYGISHDGHLVAGAFIPPCRVSLMYGNVVESLAVDTIHGVVFPYEMAWVHSAGKMAQPGCSGRVVYAVSAARDKLHVMTILHRVATLQTVEEFMCAGSEQVAGKHIVIGARA